LAASEFLARGLTRLGVKVGLGEALIGLLAALGADAPELSSAVTALASGARDVGVGVIFGSNLFNLAALLGFSSLLAGRIRIRTQPLVLDATAGMTVLLVAAALVGGLLQPAPALLLAAVLFALYVLALAGRLRALRPAFLPRAGEVAHDEDRDLPARSHSWKPVWLMPPAVAAVVLGSLAMVRSALQLAPGLHVSGWLLGSVILAALTSLPNLYVALHFARSERGTALLSAAMNSNSINLLAGLMVPALLLGAAAVRTGLTDMTWLLALTVLAVAVPLLRRGVGRAGGLVILGSYAAFVASGLAAGR